MALSIPVPCRSLDHFQRPIAGRFNVTPSTTTNIKLPGNMTACTTNTLAISVCLVVRENRPKRLVIMPNACTSS